MTPRIPMSRGREQRREGKRARPMGNFALTLVDFTPFAHSSPVNGGKSGFVADCHGANLRSKRQRLCVSEYRSRKR